MRGSVEVPAEIDDDSLKEKILGVENIRRFVPDPGKIKRFIVVPGKIVNIVVAG
jgi:hypothetical protein